MSDEVPSEPIPSEQAAHPAHRPAGFARLMLAFVLIVAALVLIGTAWKNTRAARLTDRASMLMESDKVQAHLTVERALKYWPTYPSALIFMAQLEHRLKESKKAQDLLRVAVDVAPSPGDPMYLLGSLLVDEPDKLPEGLRWFELGMRIAPPEGDKAQLAWFELAEAASKAKRHDLVIWAMLNAQKAGYNAKEGNKILAESYRALGLNEMAVIAESN